MAVDTTKTDIALMKQEIQYVKESVTRQEINMTTQHNEIKVMMKDFMEEVRGGYVTKPEHEENKKRIADLEKKRETALTEFVKYTISFILAVVTTFVLIKLWLK